MSDDLLDVVVLGEEEIKLSPPQSYAACYDVVVAAGSNPLRAFVAALGLCWASKNKPKTRYRFEPLPYGGEVLDELVERGLKPAEVQAAGVIAFNLVAAQIIDDSEVSEAEGNSEAP